MESLYSITCKLGMEMAGFTTAAGLATRFLGDIEGKAASADRTLEKLAQRFNLPVDQFVAQASSMGSYTKQIDAAAAAHANLATAISGIGKIAVGAGLVGVGLAGVGVMKGWVSAASELQGAMAGVQLATLGVGSALQQASQLTTLQDMTYSVAAKTRFSAPDIANIEKIAATSGLNKRTDLISALPTLANAAEVALQLKGTSYASSVPAFVQMAHLFQAYGGKKFNNLLDLVGRASVVSGDTPATMENTLKYLIPSVNAYGLTPEDAISVAALASNVGLSGGKGGGSRIQAMFRSIAPLLSSRGALHNKALDKIEQLGGHQFFTHGNFEAAGGVTNLLTTVMRAMERIPDQAKRIAVLNAAFNAAGGTAISSLASPGALDRFHAIQGDLRPGGIASTGEMQQTLNATWAGQTATLATNMQSLSAILGEQLLPVLTPIVHGVVEMTGALVGFLSHHKDVAQFAAIFTLVASTAALVVGPIIAVSGAMQILAAAGITVSIAFGPITLAIVGIAAAIAAGVWAWQHWGAITKWAGDTLTGVGRQIGAFLGLAGDLLGIFGQIGGAIAHDLGLDTLLSMLGTVEGAWLKFLDTTFHVGSMMRWAGTQLHDFLRWLGVLHDGPATPHTRTATVPSTPGSDTFTTPQRDKHGHVITDKHGHALTTTQQAVRATRTDSGTVGLPTTIRVAPITSTPPPHPAVTRHTSTSTAHHTSTTHHSAAVQNHHTAHHTTATTAARGGDIHLHVAAGAVVNHIAPSHGHDPKTIADEVTKRTGAALGHHIAAALRTSGVLPSTMRPTLHQIGMS